MAQRDRLVNIFWKQRHKCTSTGRQNKRETVDAQTARGASIQSKDDRALSYNSAKTATLKHSFESSAINGRAQGETGDAQMEKGEKR